MKENNISNKDLVKAVNGLSKNVDKISTATNGLTKDVKKIATSLDDLARITKSGFEAVDNRLSALETNQEDIKLRLDNVAYRFEIVEVQKRLKALEEIVLSKSKRSL